jgi:DNA anti-recombination protein RmuC
MLRISLPALAICLLASNAAFAQGRGRGGFGGGFGMGGPGMLLGNPQVQKELKMTDDQTAKIGEIQREMFAGFGQGGQGGNNQNLSDEERQKRREEFQKRNEENNKKLTAVLSADQNARLKQIQLWVGGVAGLVYNADAAKELKITDDQKEALKTITDESAKKTGELFQGLRGASQDEQAQAREKMTAMRKETETECTAVLTDEQKAQFAKMRGEKFELDMSQAFGGRGRRGRPGNN